MFGTIEVARAWFTLNVVTTAAREGARSAAVAFPGNALARINAVLAAANLTCAAPPCAVVTCTNPCGADATVQASVTVTFNTLVPVLLPMLNGITITQTATMRYEGGV
jgi:hypothetical protein